MVTIPVPAFTGVPSWSTFEDVRRSLNGTIDDLNFFFSNLDSINVKSLTADHISSGTIDANKVTIRSDLTNGYIQLDGNGFTINDGTRDTFHAGLDGQVSMTGATIMSASGYPRVEMNPVNDLFGAYFDADTYIQMFPVYLGSTPVINFHNSSTDFYVGYFSAQNKFAMTTSGSSDMEISTFGDILLNTSGTGNLYTPDWTQLFEIGGSTSLQDALDSKATEGINTSLAGALFRDGGIPQGTLLATAGGGSVSWDGISIPQHSHVQK